MARNEPQAVVVKTVEAWTQQATEAQEAIKESNGGEDPPNLRACADINYEAFCRLIEAMHALTPYTKMPVDDEMMRLARMRPAIELFYE